MDYKFAKPKEYLDSCLEELNSDYLYEFNDNNSGLIAYLVLNKHPSKTASFWYSKNLLSKQQFRLTPNLAKLLRKVEDPQKLSESLLQIVKDISVFPKSKNPSVSEIYQKLFSQENNKANLSEQNSVNKP